MIRLWCLLLPELRRLPAPERPAALKAASDTPLDVPELLGMAGGLVAVTALTRYGLADLSWATRLAAALVNLVVALPLLALALGPFHLRRLRRGLREQLQRKVPR